MEREPSTQESFSARRRWGIFFSVLVSMLAACALVVMVNYLAARHFLRLNWNARARPQLSPQTTGLLKSITNEVKVTVYYNKKDQLYHAVDELLNEYQLANPKISIQTVDYLLDSGMAMQIKDQYKNYLGLNVNKNLVIFDCAGKTAIIPGDRLGQYGLDQVPNDKQLEYEKRLKAFDGEEQFSSALFKVCNPRALTACFLDDHCDHSLEGTNVMSYAKFRYILEFSDIRLLPVNLEGTNIIPAICNLLVVAGPQIIPTAEVAKIKQFLAGGGSLFVLFNYNSQTINTGLEPILTEWGVTVGRNQVIDINHSHGSSGQDIIVSVFNDGHPLVNPFLGENLQMVLPRSVSRIDSSKPGADAPKVDELAFASSEAAIKGLDDRVSQPGKPVPLIAAVERGGVKGVFIDGNITRIVVAGDSLFLDNQMIEAVDNREFASAAVNWLLDQKSLMQGIGPHPVAEYKLVLTRSQMSQIRWLFLAIMPGAILGFGVLVWLRRRH